MYVRACVRACVCSVCVCVCVCERERERARARDAYVCMDKMVLVLGIVLGIVVLYVNMKESQYNIKCISVIHCPFKQSKFSFHFIIN